MATLNGMKLDEFLRQKNITPAAFGRQIGTSRSAVCRWIKGERTPTREIILKIQDATEGQVRANDFFEAA